MSSATDLSVAADDRLGAVLHSVGLHLVVDGADESAVEGVEVATATPLRGRRIAVSVAAALLVLVGTVLAVAPARRVVGGWLRVGRIDVELAPSADTGGETVGLPAFTDAVPRIEAADADDVLGGAMPAVGATPLGAPRDWWAPPEGGVLVGWGDGATSLWVVVTDGDERLVKQLVAGVSEVVEVPGLGDWALAVDGEHVVQTPARRVAADAVVAWTSGDLTFRLEGTAELEQLIALARQLDDTAGT